VNNNITERERKVIQLYKEGYLQSEIAKEVRMCRKTVSKILKDNDVPKYTKTIKCNWCDKEVTTEYRHQESCSMKCRTAYNKQRYKNNETYHVEQICIECKGSFFGYNKRMYCSGKCQSAEMKRKATRRSLAKRLTKALDTNRHKTCTHCDSYFYAHTISKTFCSEECYRTYLTDTKVRVSYNHKCRECGKHYTNNYKRSAGCSDKCKGRYSNRRDETNRRNKLRENGKIDWDISVERLSKRDKGLCYLCKSKTNLNDYTYDSNGYFIAGDYYPSVDHVLPVSKGGTHTWDNIKLAHRICNSLKSDNSISNKHKQLELMI